MTYRPPCAITGKCEQFGDTPLPEHHQTLCKEIGEMIANSGGGGIFEVTPCPQAALIKIGGESENPVLQGLRAELGVTTIYTETDPF